MIVTFYILYPITKYLYILTHHVSTQLIYNKCGDMALLIRDELV